MLKANTSPDSKIGNCNGQTISFCCLEGKHLEKKVNDCYRYWSAVSRKKKRTGPAATGFAPSKGH
jgi:hypothetical protein